MVDGAIFRDEKDRPLKFFIQKDLDPNTIENLHAQITANGGRVEGKIPVRGFILIEPKSPEGRRLIDCWDSTNRMHRYFVPHTFVAACLEVGKLIPQVFRKDGMALQMHIHPCITNEKLVETLRNRIWHSGGDPLATEYDADVVISDESLDGFQALVERFDHFRNKYVEGIPWVKQCVESGVYANTPVVKKNLGGRVAGNKRTEFTAEDDRNLSSYIAKRLPDPTMRGRTGNKLYQDLCSQPDLYPWAERHPWQSWRERYKNNVPRFNKLIATHIERNPPSQDGKGLHGFARDSSKSKKKTEVPLEDAHRDPADDTDAEWGSQWDVKVGKGSPPPWGKYKRKNIEERDNTGGPKKRRMDVTKEHVPSEQSDDDCHSGVVDVAAEETSNSTRTSQRSFKPDKVSADDVAESVNATSLIDISKTPNRIPTNGGDAHSHPLAGDDQGTETDEDEGIGQETQALLDAQRNLLGSPSKRSSRVAVSPTQQGSPPRNVKSPKLHSPVRWTKDDDIDHKLVLIACEYRFVLDEVKEEYLELNCDLAATRSHFKKIRDFVNEIKIAREKPS